MKVTATTDADCLPLTAVTIFIVVRCLFLVPDHQLAWYKTDTESYFVTKLFWQAYILYVYGEIKSESGLIWP